MFENYREMTPEQRDEVKAIHKAIRKDTPQRAGNLAWAFVRGIPYKRVERTPRTQVLGDGTVLHHNPPPVRKITWLLGQCIPGFAEVKDVWNTTPHPDVVAWLANPDGAIPAPVRKPKATLDEVVAALDPRAAE